MKVRRGRECGKLDNCCDQTLSKLSEWKKQLYSRIDKGEVPFDPLEQMLACEVN